MRSPCLLAVALLFLGVASLSAQKAEPVVRNSPPSEIEGKTLDKWERELVDPDPGVREYAIRAITLFGRPSSLTIKRLLSRCNDADTSPRVKAVMAFHLLEIPKDEIPTVVEAMARRVKEDRQVVVRFQAALVLLHYGDAIRPALDALIYGSHVQSGLDPTAVEFRHACILGVVMAGRTPNGPDARAVRALILALKDPASRIRLEAVMGLGTLGKPSDVTLFRAVLFGLRGLFADKDRSVSIWAHTTLMSLEGTNAEGIAFVVRGVSHTDLTVRLHAVRAVGLLGPKASRAIPTLLEMIRSREMSEVVLACWALAEVGRDKKKEILVALHDLASDKNAEPIAVQAAKEAIDRLNGKPKKGSP